MKLATTVAILSIIVLVLIAFVLIFDIGRGTPPAYLSIASFDECSQAGYPIEQSYPEKCTTPDGRSFIQAVAATTTPEVPGSGVASTTAATSTTSANVTLINIKSGASIKSPVSIRGSAPGNWFFESTLPITIVDANNAVIGTTQGHAEGDWMTTDQVVFDATTTFTPSTTKTGALVIHKDNPSGDPARDQNVRIPITFSQ